MTFGQLKGIVGLALMERLTLLNVTDLGLYYAVLPAAHERLCVRFWFPVYGGAGAAYDALPAERPTLQVDVKHYPPVGSVATPKSDKAERVWEAMKLGPIAGLGSCTRLPAGRPPARDPSDSALWDFHQYRLTV